ncbi:hypothetical protein GCM10027037_20890 [Mucilaginibacter koreensis]
MATSAQLAKQFTEIFSGQPWYGNHIYSILEPVDFETAYDRPVNAGHSIIEILLHMLSWTEEVTARMGGKMASEPAGGDWPEAGDPDEQKWPQLVNNLKLANVNLEKVIQDFPAERWSEPVNDQRGTEPVSTYQGLIEGFLQHQIYHAGQIALLTKQLHG